VVRRLTLRHSGRTGGIEPTGVVFAARDCDADAIEAWNR